MHSSSYHSSGVQALAYATSSSGWTGVDIASIVVGSVSYPTILRSSTDNLYHYNANKSAKYLVLDAFNSSVSGGGSTWGSNIEVTIGNTAKKLTIPNIYWGIYEITVGNTASFVTKNENHRFISSVSKSGNEAFINVDYPDGFDMGSTLISTMGIGSLFLWVHRTSYGSNSL